MRRSRASRACYTAGGACSEPLEPRRLLYAAPVGLEFQVNTFTSSYQDHQAIAMDADGDFVVVWDSRGQGGGSSAIYGQRYNAAGAPQGEEFRVSTFVGRQEFAEVAMDAGGNFAVVWTSYNQDGSETGVFGQRFNAAGQKLGGEFRANTTTAGSQYGGDVALDAAGNFTVVWDAGDGDDGMYMQRYDAGGNPLGGETRVNGPTDRLVRGPVISMHDGGAFLVTWEASVMSGTSSVSTDVFAQRFDAAGAKLGGEFQVNTATEFHPYYDTDAGFDAAGNFVVAWEGFRGGNHFVFFRRYDAAGQPLGGPVQVESDSNGGKFPLSIGVAPAGNFAIAHPAYAGSRIFLHQFDASGVPSGGEVVANTYATGNKWNAMLAVSDDGDMVVTWVSDGQDGDVFGIFAQRYAEVADAATVGDLVWADVNKNGVRDAGEAGIDGVVVQAFTPAGTMAASAKSANGGQYQLAGLRPGDSYYLAVSPPAAHTRTVANAGGDDALDSDIDPVTNRSHTFVLPTNGTDVTLDVGLIPPARVQGFVWNDTDADGVQDPGEPGQDGVVVELTDAAGTTLQSTTTSGGGQFQFVQFPDTSYRLRIGAVTGKMLTRADQGADDALDSDAEVDTRMTPAFAPAPGELVTNVDAGLVPITRVTGTVFRDVYGDGVLGAGDVRIGRWTVFADEDDDGQLDPGERSTTAATTTTTSGYGDYTLTVHPDTYTIVAVAPPGWVGTTPAAARTVSVAPGATAAGVNLGHAPAAPSQRHPTPVGPETRLNAGTQFEQTNASIETDADGNVVAAWYSEPGRIVVRVFDGVGNALSGDVQANVGAVALTGPNTGPRVAVEPDGDFVVVWNTGANVVARRFAADAMPIGGEFVVSQTSGNKFSPRVAINPLGGFVVAWTGATTGDSNAVVARRYDAAGAALGDEVLVNEPSTSSQSIADMAFDASGRLTVLYNNLGFGGAQGSVAYARRFDAAGTPEDAGFRVSDTVNTSAGPGAVAVNAAGDRLFTFVRGSQAVTRLFASDNTPLTGDVFLDQPQNNTQISGPQVAAGAGGYFLVAWSRFSGDNDSFGQLVGPDGLPHGREFRLNTYQQSTQSNPSVARGAGDTFVTAWTSNGQDGSLGGVYSQRFETFANPVAAGDFVWDDLDGDGVQDANEPGVGNVMLMAFNEHDSIADTVRTAPDGSYRFAGLKPGAPYRLQLAAPAGRTLTRVDRGGDDALDSDFDPTTARTPLFSIAPGQSNATLDAGLADPPKVAAVFVAGTAWTSAFRNVLQSSNQGEAAFGFRLTEADQGSRLPWTNLNQVSIRFSEGVIVQAEDLALLGYANPAYAIAPDGFRYDPTTFTATWTLATAGVPAELLRLELDAKPATGVTDAHGFPVYTGGSFADVYRFQATILPGDVNRSGGSVIGSDVTLVRNAQNSPPGVFQSLYTIFKDVNGSGSILGSDVTAVRNRQGTSVPAAPPSMAMSIGERSVQRRRLSDGLI